MSSAVDELIKGYETSTPVTYYDYYNAYGRDHSPTPDQWVDMNPENFLVRFSNWFNGRESSAKQAYENYLSSYENYQNKKAQQSEWAREDTKVQRAIKDIQAAGLNPWLALNGGSMSSAIGATESASVRYKAREQQLKDGKNNDAKLLGTAIKILLMAAIMAS